MCVLIENGGRAIRIKKRENATHDISSYYSSDEKQKRKGDDAR